MEVPFAQSLEVARRTKSASGTVVWNLAPVPEQMTSEMIRDLLAATDYLLVNEHEALDAAAAIGLRIREFRNGGRRTGKGRQPHMRGDRRRTRRGRDHGGRHPRASVPSPNIIPVDTTGAGDTFVGAFASMLSEQAPLQRALTVGCEAAALKCLKAGAQDGMPMRAAIKSITLCDG